MQIEYQNDEENNYGFVGDDVFADWEPHTRSEAKRRTNRTGNNSVSAHNTRRYVAQSAGHFCRSEFQALSISLSCRNS